MLDHARSGGVYRTHASLPPCLGCAPLAAVALAAYLSATHAQRAASSETLVCDSCGRTCGVRLWVGARTRDLAAEMDHVDRAIGEWSVRLRDGAPAPTPVLALMARKEVLEAELRGIAMSLVMPSVAPSSAMRDGPAISIWERVVGWFCVRGG